MANLLVYICRRTLRLYFFLPSPGPGAALANIYSLVIIGRKPDFELCLLTSHYQNRLVIRHVI